jgi:hypothetical protein
MSARVKKCAKKSYFFEKVDYLGGSRAGKFLFTNIYNKSSVLKCKPLKL